MILGCIADDLTGATDLALTLTRSGLRTVQTAGNPSPGLDLVEVDAVVVALKSRTIPANDAVALSLDAARALRAFGARRLLFKYCSTFDSTDAGNIGPVAEALLGFAGGSFTIACPAFPRAGRTLYSGHLFVGTQLLCDSPMKDHPLTPMRDSNLVAVLQRQTALPVGLVGFADVDAGPARIRAAGEAAAAAGRRALIVDALTDAHLEAIGAALSDLPLITGGSGIAMGLAAAYVAAGLLPALTPAAPSMAAPPGRCAILAGSCSTATRRQVEAALAADYPALRLDPVAIAAEHQTPQAVLAWVDAQPSAAPLMIYSSADPRAVEAAQARLGRDKAGHLVESLLGAVAQGLVARGFARLLVAGGETSGAVVQALGVTALAIGPEIDPGVPWTRSLGTPDLALALKSGNFGTPDFFIKAWSRLD